MDSKERKIAVAVDESEESMYALSWFLQNLVPENENTQNTLVLIYAAPPPPIIYSPLAAAGQSLAFVYFLVISVFIGEYLCWIPLLTKFRVKGILVIVLKFF